MSERDHWERIYSTRPPEALGWYTPHLRTSLDWIRELDLPADAPIIDIGGGASTLVDELLEAGHEAVTVLDLSETALSVARRRLGATARSVTWKTGDITSVELPAHGYALWHDRAVFHFVTEAADRRRYRDNLLGALRPGGHVIIGTFAPEAPPRCSGLPVRRYDRERLEDALGDAFELTRHHEELHTTPGGVEQMYTYCRFRRRA